MPGSYRILRVSSVHQDRIRNLELFSPENRAKSTYASLMGAFFEQSLMYSDSFSVAMRSLGQEASEILFDLDPLQQKWAEENRMSFDPKAQDLRAERLKVALAQIESYRPEILYFQDIHSIPFNVRRELKTRYPFIKKIFIYKGFPSHLDQLSGADLIFAATPMIVDELKSRGYPTQLLYHAFDERILERLKDPNPEIPFSFVGSSGYGLDAHNTRYRLLREVIPATPLELWVHDRISKKELAARRRFKARIKRLLGLHKQENPPIVELFPERCHPPEFGLPMFEILKRSKVTLNQHTESVYPTVGNLRLFEATGVGTCLLTDKGSNLSDLFVADEEVATFGSPEECIEKAKYLLENDKARREIAARGHARTLRSHRIYDRCQVILERIALTLEVSSGV